MVKGWQSFQRSGSSVLSGIVLGLFLILPIGESLSNPDTTDGTVVPPFSVRVHVLDGEGTPREGIRMRCFHPRKGEPLVDQTLPSNASGVVEFKIEAVDFERDKKIAFLLADPDFISDGTVTVKPIAGIFDATSEVHPMRPLRITTVNEQGEPVPNVEVYLCEDYEGFPKCEPGFTHISKRVSTDQSGESMIPYADVLSNVLVMHPEYALAYYEGVDLFLEDGHLPIRLEAGWTIEGRLVDHNGNGLPGCGLLAGRKDFPYSHASELYLRSRSDDDGFFRFDHVPFGVYDIMMDPENWAVPEFFGPTKSSLKPISELFLHRKHDLTIRTEPATFIRGYYVSDEVDVGGRRFYVHVPKVGKYEITTRADGSFSFVLPYGVEGIFRFVGVGKYILDHRFGSLSNYLQRRNLSTVAYSNIPPGEYRDYEIHLIREGRIEGLALDEMGDPIKGLEAYLQPEGRWFRVDDEGRFSVKVHPRSVFRFDFHRPHVKGPVLTTDPVEVGEGEMVEVEYTIPDLEAMPPPASTLAGSSGNR